jgi:hypothetical protein
LGVSEKNAVNEHQSDHNRVDTCFISTTKSFEKAKGFATINGLMSGVVLTLDRSLFAEHGITEIELINQFNSHEFEISIRAKDYGEIPQEVIVETTHVKA